MITAKPFWLGLLFLVHELSWKPLLVLLIFHFSSSYFKNQKLLTTL